MFDSFFLFTIINYDDNLLIDVMYGVSKKYLYVLSSMYNIIHIIYDEKHDEKSQEHLDQ